MIRADSVAPLKCRDGEPAFAEPWQAQVMAVAAALVAAGRFSAADWSNALGAEIARANAAGQPDNADTYYRSALEALEHLAKAHDLTDSTALAARKEAWIEAYEHTPHGRPVELKR